MEGENVFPPNSEMGAMADSSVCYGQVLPAHFPLVIHLQVLSVTGKEAPGRGRMSWALCLRWASRNLTFSQDRSSRETDGRLPRTEQSPELTHVLEQELWELEPQACIRRMSGTWGSRWTLKWRKDRLERKQEKHWLDLRGHQASEWCVSSRPHSALCFPYLQVPQPLTCSPLILISFICVESSLLGWLNIVPQRSSISTWCPTGWHLPSLSKLFLFGW